MSSSLLVELFTEELPPKALRQLGEAFGLRLQDALVRSQLKDDATSDTRIFATPRRLAVLIKDVRAKAADRTESKKLMPSKVAFGAEGKPSAALAKRLQKEGATAAQLEHRIEGDNEYAFLKQTIPGVTLAAALQSALQDVIAKLPIPKLMSYQLADGATTVQFVRPAHGLVALYGADVVDVSVLGLKAGRVTHGHRFQGVPDIPVAAADAYEEALAAHGRVIAAFDARRADTERQLRAKAADLGASLGPEEDVAALLDEVTALIEYPSVYVGEFAPEFLAVPQECLILTMRQNQKYFPLFDAAGKLINKFLIVSNMRLADPKNIVEGNQRVVGPRLEDARFFYNQDRKQRLEERVPRLARVVYHNKLGSQLERVERVQLLAGKIARALGADVAAAERAAWLSKADLLTSMVGEFPELQGVMGRFYAINDREGQVVADAIEAHYRPRFSGDALPQGHVAASVALADKLDTLVGIFGIGVLPSGDKDPFALRRHALGILRILMETPLALDLFELLDDAEKCFPPGVLNHNANDLRDFFGERLKNYLRDRGEEPAHIEAVIAQLGGLIHEAPIRLLAVQHFAKLPEAKDLATANKRVLNIIKKNEEIGYKFSPPNRALMKESAEFALMDALERLTPVAERDFAAGNYESSLRLLAGIKPDVDRFFDEVMVMVEDQKVRNNRAALLQQLGILMNRVADISKLAA